MDDATSVGHFILIGVFASVIIIQGMHNAQIEKEFVQNLDQFFISLHIDLCWVPFLRGFLRGSPPTAPQQLLLLRTHFFNQIVSDILQDWVLGGQTLVERKKNGK